MHGKNLYMNYSKKFFLISSWSIFYIGLLGNEMITWG